MKKKEGDVDSDMEVELGDDNNVNNIENISDLEYEEETKCYAYKSLECKCC